MLAIRMQRTGRKGHAMFRVVVQDSRQTPTSGRVVANLGHYDPHTKAVTVDTEKAGFYLTNGAQPSERVARLLQKEGVKLPDWVTLSENKERKTRNPEKLRKDQPEQPKEESTEPEAPAADVADETTVDEAPETPDADAAVAEEAPAEQTKE